MPVGLWEHAQGMLDGHFAKKAQRRSSGIRLNTSGFRIASTPFMSTSSMVSLMRPFSRKCRTNGVKSRAAAFARLSGTKIPISLTWTRQLLALARNVQRLFAKQEPREKRRLLDFVLSNCTWEDGNVVATFRQPFDLLAEKRKKPPV